MFFVPKTQPGSPLGDMKFTHMILLVAAACGACGEIVAVGSLHCPVWGW